jgi:GGDEF domain-containing protein
MAIKAGDATWDLVVVPTQSGPASFYRVWLVLAAALLVLAAVPAYAEDLPARIGRHLSAPFSIKGHKIRITSSIGIALYSRKWRAPRR